MNATSHTMTSGGYTYTVPRVRHQIELYDVETGKMAWVGGTFTRGNRFAGFKELIEAVASKVTKTLRTEGFLPPHTR